MYKKHISFQDAKDRLKNLLIVALVTAGLNLLMTVLNINSPVIMAALIFIPMIMMGAIIYTIIRYCRCPSCGKIIYFGVFKKTICPRCKRNLISGKKGKK